LGRISSSLVILAVLAISIHWTSKRKADITH